MKLFCHFVLFSVIGTISQCYVLQETDMTGKHTDGKRLLTELLEVLRARDDLTTNQEGKSDQADESSDSHQTREVLRTIEHKGTVARAGIPLHQEQQSVRQLSTRTRAGWDASESAAIVREHNDMRRLAQAANMEMLVWNSELGAKAQELASTCVFDHDIISWPGSPYAEVGQNLWISSSHDYNEAIDGWYNEIMYYTYGGNPPCRHGEVCGHYTQLMWAKSKEVGCGVAFCRTAPSQLLGTTFTDSYMTVCNYGPQGNMQGELPYLTGSPCSQCGGAALWCKNQLCASNGCSGNDCRCDARCVNGNLDSRTCTCNCRDGYIGADCSEICEDKDHSCGPMNGWPSIWCNDPNYPYVTERCPLMCGQCTPPGGEICQDKNHYCNANPGWDTTWCREHYVQYECPKMCGQC